jgi:transcriptional regulator with PAS, ATPase and Fis domain
VIEQLKRELEQRYSFHDIISKNARMLEVFDILPSIAESNSTVLIEGESGTGKELVARAIHDLSPRRDGPMITLNCGALPDTLLEAELFGYKAGAFTDARTDKPGRFALAEGGTILLDEIGDTSPAFQTKLLRVLEERIFEPLGGTEPVAANVRVLAATNRDLAELVAEKSFRRDLYYRINVIRLHLPPLRERREDIPLLIDHFISHYSSVNSRAITDISPRAIAALMKHDYPGNVRELQNVIEHACILCRGSVIEIDDLPDHLRSSPRAIPAGQSSMEQMEAHLILATLRKYGWNRNKTAAELGIHKTTLWRRMKRLGIQKPS